ncbi:MAG: hypothetical protein LBI02_00305, partial [Opitutaceae bacterium]|nr:hypothetical protein [Opitutaceae bacterium]
MKTLRAPTLCLARRVFSALLLTLLASGAITSPTHAAKKKSENKPKRAISTTSGHKLEWEMSYGG